MARTTGIAIAIAVATAIALTAAPAFAKPILFKAHLNGAEQVPARETHARGQASLMLSDDQTSIHFRIVVSNIENVVAVRLQNAPTGVTGAEVAVLYGPVAPGGGKTSGVLTTGTLTGANLVGPLAGRPLADLVSEIQTGRIYVNVVTDDGVGSADEKPGDFSSGEIRGQLR